MNDFLAQRSTNNTFKLLIIIIIVIALGGVIGKAFFYGPSKEEMPNENGYQAVFLSTNQVYFGKLTMSRRHYVLRDVYYLQTGRVPQPSESETKTETKLIKLGDEVHAPEDEMFISKENLSYWENLKDSGKVVEAIKKHKAQQSVTPAAPK